MIKYSTQFNICHKNGGTIPVQVKLRDNPNLAPAFPNKEFLAAMETDPDFSITLMDCKKFGGRCSSQNAGCLKMRTETTPDYKEIKRSLVDSLRKKGFQVDKAARFFYSRHEDKAGMLIGTYCHSCHVETSEFYALLDSEGNLVQGDDFWWREI